jgi:Spy/CpxP family protein refolding chaperone
MNTLNKKIVASVFAASIAMTAGMTFAKGNGQQANQGQRLDYIFTQLDLTETQQAEVLEVLANVREEQRQIMWDNKQAMKDREDAPTREEMEAIRTEHQTAMSQLVTDQLNTVLSTEVTEELVEYLDAHKGFGKQGGRGGQGGEGRRGK